MSLPRTEPSTLRQVPVARAELMAPAGEPDAAYAAFHYGADAVYLGLPRFSARAEAVNFSLDQLGELVAFAHAATPRRKVYLALNTLVTNRELEPVVDMLAEVAALGVDALIVQDLGVAAVARGHFPELRLHSSTQMAIHNPAGAMALRDLGFRRVTLARELTIEEAGEIATKSGLEVEVFVHGALCYSYSGLCLYSSLLRGRSGNRGRCTYPCRDRFDAGEGAVGYPFSMKDLALPGELAALRAAGVSSFKIEGRKKSPLYVACTVALYRGLLDGTLKPADRERMECDIRTVFSRPWTSLYARSARNRDVTDRDTVGHRGALIGRVLKDIPANGQPAWIGFRTSRRVELHDGVQVDVPGQGRPYGFAVDTLRLAGVGDKPGKVFEAPPESTVEIGIPPDHPRIPAGAPVYCASSQEVKQRYRFDRPKAGEYRVRRAMDVDLAFEVGAVMATGRLAPLMPTGPEMRVAVSVEGTFEVSRNPAEGAAAARKAFERLGNTGFSLGAFRLANLLGLYVSPSVLNRLRRELTDRLEAQVHEAVAGRARVVRAAIGAQMGPGAASVGPHADDPVWSIKTDCVDALQAFGAADWAGLGEVVVEVGTTDVAGLARLASRVGREKVRLALPLITRAWETGALTAEIAALAAAGWRRWEAAGLSAWTFLRAERERVGFDLVTDWTVYVPNRAAARHVLGMGANGFTLSPEDGNENMFSLLAEFGPAATVVVYQDLPLFISETCVGASLSGKCAGPRECRNAEMSLVGESGEKVRVVARGCRAVTIGEKPFCMGAHIPELVEAGARRLRIDFLWRHYTATEAVEVWRRLREGSLVPGTRDGNWAQGMA